MKKIATALERMMTKVKIEANSCWTWQGSLSRDGYGWFWMDGRNLPAHRASYMLLVGPVPDGKPMDHLCRNRACVNPTHLEIVTPAVNTQRALPYGIHPASVSAKKTHCPKGHEYSEENTYMTRQGHRQCRVCKKEAWRRWKQRAVAGTVGAVLIAGAPSAEATSTSKAWPTPNLRQGFTPQGATLWYRSGPNMIVMAEYRVGANTRLVAVDPRNGSIYGQVSIAENHAGGIAIVGDWLFVQDQPHMSAEAVRQYRLTDIAKAFDKSHKAKGHPTYVKQAGLQQLDTWQYASFMTADGKQLLAGHYCDNAEGSRMYRYNVDQKTGRLTSTGYVTAPLRTQGVAMFGKTVVYTSHLLLTYGSKQIAIPDHAEGLVVLNGIAYVSFEGSAPNVLKIKL